MEKTIGFCLLMPTLGILCGFASPGEMSLHSEVQICCEGNPDP